MIPIRGIYISEASPNEVFRMKDKNIGLLGLL